MITVRKNGFVATKVYTGKIVAMNYPGGQVYAYCKHQTDAVEDLAQTLCPVRSGSLRASIRGEIDSSPVRVTGRVIAHRKYAAWVHEGTHDKEPIHSPNGIRMSLPAGGGYSARRLWEVQGQDAQPFLADALTVIVALPYRAP